MIGQLLPPPVQVGEAFADRPDVVLYPQESAVIVRAVEQRRREFATVRACARDALSALGVESAPIVPGLRGAPIWPPGVVGSMTHCPGYRGAAVARSTDFSSVGIDAEVDQPLPRGLIDKIMLPEEHVGLAELDNCGVCPDRLLFCVKETIYKTWFPLTHRYLGFHEACATLHRNGTFTALVRLADPAETSSWPTTFSGRWLAGNGLVLSASSIAAGG
jgi:4'-phosphopantetheinyl transferase EntD